MNNNPTLLPLVVDLDGTLIKTDLLMETASQFVFTRPNKIYKLVCWFFEGKKELKFNLANETNLDYSTLPYNENLINWLKNEKDKGREIILATASHQILANQVAAHLGFFNEIFASDSNINLIGNAKRNTLVKKYGSKGFDYIGNDYNDIPVWKEANLAHVVTQSSGLISDVRSIGNLGSVINDDKSSLVYNLIKAMRPYQWVKNLLVYLPLLTAHQYLNSFALCSTFFAFLIFSFTASSVYLINDLVDIDNDRHHKTKRYRPFASGNLSLLIGWIAWPILLTISFSLSILTLPNNFILILSIYFILTLLYSLKLKSIPLVDVITLASLYTLRIISGAVAISVTFTFWLLSFSMFLFLSLAFIKRYSELRIARLNGNSCLIRGRGYGVNDIELVSNLGTSAGYICVLVLALYIQDSHTADLYLSPQWIWLSCPRLLFWISRTWLIAHRGQMNDDPIVFALKDRVSWIIATLFILTFILATVGA